MKKTFLKIIIPVLVCVLFIATGVFAQTPCAPWQGCSGATSTPESGQIFIGNASGTYSVVYLTAGANVTIATTSGGSQLVCGCSHGDGDNGDEVVAVVGVLVDYPPHTVDHDDHPGRLQALADAYRGRCSFHHC